MKRLLFLLVCLVPLAAGARNIPQNETENFCNSRRSSLGVILLYHENTPFCREIQEEFLNIPFPSGYNQNNINPCCFPIASSTSVDKRTVDRILAANKIAEQLLSENTFVLVCDMTGRSNGGFSISMNAYLYQLVNNGRTQKLEHIGVCSVNSDATIFNGNAEMHKVIRDACSSTLGSAVDKLARKYNIFKSLTSFQTYGGQGLYSYIGTKEGVSPRKQYEIVKPYINDFKQLDFKRLSLVTPVDIWDNVQFEPSLDSLEGERGTQFKTIKGKSLDKLSESEQLMRAKTINSHIPNYFLTLNYNSAGGYGVMLGMCGPVGYYCSILGNIGITDKEKNAYHSFSISESGNQRTYHYWTPEVTGSTVGPVTKVKSGIYACFSFGLMAKLAKNSLFGYAGVNYSEIDAFYSDGKEMNYVCSFCNDYVGVDAGLVIRCKSLALNVGVVATPGCDIYPYRMNVGVGFSLGGKRR